jgi:hypothetical protein
MPLSPMPRFFTKGVDVCDVREWPEGARMVNQNGGGGTRPSPLVFALLAWVALLYFRDTSSKWSSVRMSVYVLQFVRGSYGGCII